MGLGRNWWGSAEEEDVKDRILDYTAGGEKYGVPGPG